MEGGGMLKKLLNTFTLSVCLSSLFSLVVIRMCMTTRVLNGIWKNSEWMSNENSDKHI